MTSLLDALKKIEKVPYSEPSIESPVHPSASNPPTRTSASEDQDVPVQRQEERSLGDPPPSTRYGKQEDIGSLEPASLNSFVAVAKSSSSYIADTPSVTFIPIARESISEVGVIVPATGPVDEPLEDSASASPLEASPVEASPVEASPLAPLETEAEVPVEEGRFSGSEGTDNDAADGGDDLVEPESAVVSLPEAPIEEPIRFVERIVSVEKALDESCASEEWEESDGVTKLERADHVSTDQSVGQPSLVEQFGGESVDPGYSAHVDSSHPTELRIGEGIHVVEQLLAAECNEFADVGFGGVEPSSETLVSEMSLETAMPRPAGECDAPVLSGELVSPNSELADPLDEPAPLDLPERNRSLNPLEVSVQSNLDSSVVSGEYEQLYNRIISELPAGLPGTVAFSSHGHDDHTCQVMAHIACLYARNTRGTRKRVLLVDAALTTQELSRQMQLQNGSGLAEFLNGLDSWQDVVAPTGVEDVYVLAAGGRADRQRLNSARLLELFDSLTETFHLILVDAGPAQGPLIRALSQSCDSLYFLLRLGRSTPDDVTSSVQELAHGADSLRGCIVTNVAQQAAG